MNLPTWSITGSHPLASLDRKLTKTSVFTVSREERSARRAPVSLSSSRAKSPRSARHCVASSSRILSGLRPAGFSHNAWIISQGGGHHAERSHPSVPCRSGGGLTASIA